MNILFCIGRNYCHFSPLHQFAQRFAKKLFGETHQMFFCNSLESKDEDNKLWLDSLEFCLNSVTNLLIVASRDSFDKVLKLLKEMQRIDFFKESFVNSNLLELECVIKAKTCKIYLCDLQKVFANQAQSQAKEIFPVESLSCRQKMFLYLLGLDLASAQTLIYGIAKDFDVNLEILNADSNLEILTATSSHCQSLQEFAKIVQSTFVDKIFVSFNLAQSVIDLLVKHQLKITAAESCTGGLIAYYLTKESGASSVFDGSVVSYANEIKESWLEVSNEHLEYFGAVSEAVVRDMLEGALRLSGADFALATSGIAGPSGGSEHKPVGMVFIGAKNRNGTEIIECLHFQGDRNYIQEQATIYAYLLFLRIFLLDY